MVKDAEAKADEDKNKKDLINEKNTLDQLIYSTEKAVSENKEKISEDEKKEIDDAVAKAKESLGSENIDELKKASEDLTKVSHKMAEKMYQDASSPQQEEQVPDSNNNEDKKDDKDVIDAEFTDK